MKLILTVIMVVIVAYVSYQSIRIKKLADVSRELIDKSTPFQQHNENPTKSVLIIGDSVSYGVGASSPENSFPGYIGQAYPNWEIVNRSKSGREISEALEVLHSIYRSDWDLIILQISGNDIFHLNSLEQSKTDLRLLFQAAKDKAEQVIYVTTGSIGHAPLIPQPFDWLYSMISKKYIDQYVAIAEENNVMVVNNYRNRRDDIFESDPDKYYSADKFHPSSAGYKVWFHNLDQVLSELK